MIMRIWRGITPKEQGDAYLEHLQQTALPALAEQAGQRGAWVLRRVQGDRCEFQLLTLWDSIGFYPASTDTSVKPHHGAGGVSWRSEENTAKSSSVKRLA